MASRTAAKKKEAANKTTQSSAGTVAKASAIILAGGKSQRMGRDKTMADFQGEPLLTRAVRLLRPLFDELIVVTNQDLQLVLPDVKITHDVAPYQGPLGGIYAGLLASANDLNFAVACDMPFISAEVIAHLWQKTSDADVVVPETSVGLEPLHAFYRRSCLPAIKEALEKGERRVISFFPQVTVETVKLTELSSITNVKRSFLNVNTEDELRRAAALDSLDQKSEDGYLEPRRIPVERSTTIYVNEEELVTIQSSLQHLDELAVGFLVAEGFLSSPDELKKVKVDRENGQVWIEVAGSKQLSQKMMGKRFLTSGCGKGFSFSSLGDARGIKPIESTFKVDKDRLIALMKQFLTEGRTPGLHASALADSQRLVAVRKDIGRHNTMDMLVGQLFLDGLPQGNLMILTTGRISYEMVVKAAKARVPLVASRTAATDLAIELAKQLGIELVGYVRGKNMTVYTEGKRLISWHR